LMEQSWQVHLADRLW